MAGALHKQVPLLPQPIFYVIFAHIVKQTLYAYDKINILDITY